MRTTRLSAVATLTPMAAITPLFPEEKLTLPLVVGALPQAVTPGLITPGPLSGPTAIIRILPPLRPTSSPRGAPEALRLSPDLMLLATQPQGQFFLRAAVRGLLSVTEAP